MAKEQSRVATLDDESTTDSTAAIPATESPANVVSGSQHDDQLCGKKVRIEIHETEAQDGKDDVFVQINGYAYSIKRGVEVVIPVEVLHVLENANMTVYGASNTAASAGRIVRRFPYSVHGSAE